MEFSALLALIPALPEAQLREVHQKSAEALGLRTQSSQSAKPAQNSSFPEELYRAMCGVLEPRHGAKMLSYHVFKTTAKKNHDAFLHAAQVVADANKGWFPKQSQAQQQSMLRLYSILVVARHDLIGIGLQWPLLIDTLSQLPAVIDAAFPGYAHVGMLPLVMELRTKNKDKNVG